MPAITTAVTTVCAGDILPEAIPWAKRIWSGAGRVYQGPWGSWVDIAWRAPIKPVPETLRQEMALFPDIALLVVALLSWDWDDSDVLMVGVREQECQPILMDVPRHRAPSMRVGTLTLSCLSALAGSAERQ